MKKGRLQSKSFVILVLALILTTSSVALGSVQDKSLYERIGGYNALALVVDDFITRLVTDKQFEKFFSGHGNDSKKRIRQHILDQFCAATGGPCIYTGREMKTTHAGLGITNAEWDAAAKHLTASLDKFKVPEREGRSVGVRYEFKERYCREIKAKGQRAKGKGQRAKG